MQKSHSTTKKIKVKAPGRINLIGEHTDYNDGFVLPAAIDKAVVVELRANGSQTVNLLAKQQGQQFSFDVKGFEKEAEQGWHNYIMGVVAELQKLGGKIEGFDASFDGNVPIGSGMSSSAALECSFAFGLNELFELGFTKWQLIKAAQMAEHNFVGTRCGIMDQFASILGKKDQLMLLDCRSLEFQYFPLDLGEYQVLLLNTNVSHSLANSDFNKRRAECERGVELIQAKLPNIQKLRDVNLTQLEACKDILPETIFKRCLHVVTENNRVLKATKALQAGELEVFGQLIYASHFSLQHQYEVSCPELDFLVKQTLNKTYVLGSRMMGGGFGGCTINIVEKARVEAFIEQSSKDYYAEFGVQLTPIEVKIEEGAGIVF